LSAIVLLHLLSPVRAGTLSVTNGSFTNLTGLSVNIAGQWYGGVPAGWSTASGSSGSFTVLNSGGTYYANLDTLGPSSPSFTPLRQNVGTVDITSDVTITFTLTTLGGTSSLGAALYDLALAAYTSALASTNISSITGVSTVSFSAKGVGPGTALYMAFWDGGGSPGITGVSIADTATTYLWNGGASGVWTNGGGGWTDKFDNTAATYNNAKPVVAQFTNASAGTNVTVAANGVNVGNVVVGGGDYAFSGGAITMTNTTWSVSNAVATVSGALAGTTGLTKSGSGTLVLAASNTYSGGTTLSAGTLALSNANALGAGNLTVNGGTLDLGGNNLTAANLGGSGGTISLGANTLTASMTTGGQFNGTISGSGGFVKSGASFLTLAGSNSYTGGTTVNAGTLFVIGSGTLGDAAGTVTVSNAVLDLRNQQTRTGTITMIGQDARLLSGTGAGSLVNNGGALQFGGGQITNISISGTGGLNVTGGGSLNSSNSFTGATTISGTTGWYGANTLFVVNAHALGAASGDLTISGGTVNLQNNTINRSGNVTISGGTINAGTLSKSGGSFSIQGGTNNAALAGTAGLIKSGAGTATLNATNTYSGDTAVSAGRLVVNGTLSAGAGALTIDGSGGAEVVLDLGSQQTRTGTITMTGQNARLVSSTGAGSLVNNGGALQFGGGLISASISGTGGLNVTGGGSLNSSNSFTGATTISGTTGWYGANTLFVVNAHALGAASGDLTISGGTVNLQDNTIARSGNVTISGGTINAGTLSKDGGNFGIQGGTINAVLGGTAGLVKSGAGTATFGASNSYAGATDLQGGTLSLSSNGRLAAGAVTISNGASLDFATGSGQTNIVANDISGAGQLLNNNSSETRFTGSVTSTGGLTINSGTVRIGNGGTNGLYTGDTALNGGTLAFDRSDTFTYGGIISGSGSLAKVSSGTVVLAGNSTNFSGTLTIFAGTARIGDGATNGLFSGNTTVNGGGTLAFDRSDASSYSGTISGAGAVVKVNTGAMTLTASNSYSGSTTLFAGTLVADHASALGSGNITFSSGGGNTGTIRYTAASAGTDWASRIQNSTGTIRLDTDGNNVALAGAIDSSNTQGLVKSGSGSLTLSGANPYTGTTAVTAGVLELASTGGAAAGGTSAVSVGTGATLLLSQSDQVNNAATVTLSGGTIRRASGVSEVFGNLNLTASSFLDFNSGAAGSLSFGGIDYTPSALLALQLVNFTQGNSLVIQTTTDLTSYIGTGFTSSGAGGIGGSSFDGTTFTITAIPEPSTYLAAAGLLAMMLWSCRRPGRRPTLLSKESLAEKC
jgi:autotransporter-associated beta strand protein